MIRIVFLLGIMLFFACKQNKNSAILSTDKMIIIIRELSEAEVFVTNYVMKDSSKKFNEEVNKQYLQIFNLHHTDSKVVLQSFDYYLAHPNELKVILDSAQTQSRKVQITTLKTALTQ